LKDDLQQERRGGHPKKEERKGRKSRKGSLEYDAKKSSLKENFGDGKYHTPSAQSRRWQKRERKKRREPSLGEGGTIPQMKKVDTV